MSDTNPVIPSPEAGLNTWLTYLEALHPTAIDMGLDRVQKVATKLSLKPSAVVFTVAGTNGKGSSVRLLETMLRAQGYHTGVYISPHIEHYNERVRIDTEQLNDADHVAAFKAVEAARGGISLTYFEFGTLAALWLLQQQPLDAWILEVGLGGRLDAVNIIDADVALLTSIGIDHVQFLGPDRASIAREKAGIFRPQRAAIVGEPDLPESARIYAESIHAELYRVGYEFNYQRHDDQQTWAFAGVTGKLESLPLPQLPLANAATVIAALQAAPLKVSIEAIRQGLRNAREPGRLQYLSGPPPVLLDVAHNPHAANFLSSHIEQLRQHRPRKVYGVIGMLHDKDIQGTIAALADQVDEWFFASLAGPRGATAAELQSAANALNQSGSCFDTVPEAFAAACSAADENESALVLVCGSFYTVAQIPTEE